MYDTEWSIYTHPDIDERIVVSTKCLVVLLPLDCLFKGNLRLWEDFIKMTHSYEHYYYVIQ